MSDGFDSERSAVHCGRNEEETDRLGFSQRRIRQSIKFMSLDGSRALEIHQRNVVRKRAPSIRLFAAASF